MRIAPLGEPRRGIYLRRSNIIDLQRKAAMGRRIQALWSQRSTAMRSSGTANSAKVSRKLGVVPAKLLGFRPKAIASGNVLPLKLIESIKKPSRFGKAAQLRSFEIPNHTRLPADMILTARNVTLSLGKMIPDHMQFVHQTPPQIEPRHWPEGP
jgi:hypothetical protein